VPNEGENFIDANIFIRYLSGDDLDKFQRTKVLFQKAKNGKILLSTTSLVIAEVYYVLGSKKLYNFPKNQIADLLLPFIFLSNLKIEDKSLVIKAISMATVYDVDFEDAYSLAYMNANAIESIYSYDKDFDKAIGVERLEP